MEPNTQTGTALLYRVIGKTLGQYRVDGVLGHGGMGIVYRAYDLKLQRPVALKSLPPELTSDPDRRKRFLLEARAAARINHPAIAQVYDVDEFEETTFLAMELVDGRTVRQLIESRELDLLGAIDIAIQVADGLASAHGMGIVHRDIKPANVVVTREGHAKILDFGLAKLMDPEQSTIAASGLPDLSALTRTQAGAIKGTPAYMSPEQVKGTDVDARSDIFSLGVMLFEMATGQAPFQGDTPMETMHAVAFDDTPSVHTRQPNLPADLQRILSRCLQKRAEERYASARELAQELRRLRRETESGQAQPVPLPERLANWCRSVAHLQPAQYAWLAAGLIAAAVVVYLVVTNVRLGPFVTLAVIGLLVYRRIRHQPQRLLESFVHQVARIPEVRVIACQDRRLTVVVDREISQLYGRIHDHLNQSYRKLFFGEGLSVSIRHNLSPDELRQLLNGPGVHYVREEPEPTTPTPIPDAAGH